MIASNLSNSSGPSWSPSHPIFTMVAQVLMFIAIAVLNVLTLVVMATTPKLQTIPNTYISALAVSDLLVSFNQLIAIPWTYPDTHVYFEEYPALCMFFKCMLHINELSSIFTIALIGVDRFLYIRHPFWYIRVVTKTKVKITLVVMWVVCFVTAIPIRTIDSGGKFPGCDPSALLYDSEMAGYVHGSLFFLICFTLFVAYGVVIRTAVQQARAIRSLQPRCFTTTNTSPTSTTPITTATTVTGFNSRSDNATITTTIPPPEQTVQKESLEASVSLKIVQKMAGVFLVLFVCWTPYVLVGLMGPATLSPTLVLMTGFFAAFNSAANFGVYALGDREFRAATFRVVCCKGEHCIDLSSHQTTLSERHSS